MDRKDAERVIEQMTRPVFAFALKRCKTTEDAEDLSQEILLRAYRSLIARDDVEDPEKFTWTVAHNALANYYRDYRGGYVGVMIDDFAETLGVWDEYFKEDDGAAIDRMRREIAYLSKLQRRIVIAYYYEGKKQQEIANELGIPLGTVKWHLFEAKRELKKGMEKMRDTSELKFNPIKFTSLGISGSVESDNQQLKAKSILSQNILYATYREPLSVNEIADRLGVSPVYIENDVEELEKIGHLIRRGEKYYGNVLINDESTEGNELFDEVYEKASKLVACEIYDEIVNSGLLDDGTIKGGIKDPASGAKFSKNYFMWALFPAAAYYNPDGLFEIRIPHEKVMTIRPDGSRSLCYASVNTENAIPSKYHDSLDSWCGPVMSGRMGERWFVRIDTEWSGNRISFLNPSENVKDRRLLERYLAGDDLSIDETTYLVERGYISVSAGNDNKKTDLRCVFIPDIDTTEKLLEIGGRVKMKHKAELEALKEKLTAYEVGKTPDHLKEAQKYISQYTFSSDGAFLLACMRELVDTGKLLPVSEDEKRSLHTIILPYNLY